MCNQPPARIGCVYGLLALLLAGINTGVSGAANAEVSFWPAITREQRPWAYWWWMGSAVDKTNLTRELTRYHDAGYGGVHIIPIYGAKGWETNYISYLSPRWMEMLDHTVREAKRLDMGVDMTTGTGWCFGGGPYVGEQEGNANVVVKTFDLAAGAKLTEKFDPKKTQALVAFPSLSRSSRGDEAQTSSGHQPSTINHQPEASLDLTSQILADGSVSWTAPEGGAKIYAISQKLNAQKVKRPAPGGEGPMLNLIYPNAMPVFLRSHTEAFAKYRGAKPRAQYHDSYEYKTDWSPDFFAQFERRRGYKLQSHLPELFDSKSTDHAPRTTDSSRVLADYRETVSDIMVEDSLPQWIKWSHDRGFITRNEAHGSPGNLLDLYALADVPETEMFRLDRNKLISKFASSAAHVAGRKFVGCETGTWITEHFTEKLSDMKLLLDDLFVSGVNHVFYHGTCYSPDEAAWPGWVFYASYEMNPRNAVWRDARALNDYVARCQSILQSGKSDNDILLYWPINDFWQKTDASPLLPHMTVHARGWFESQPIGHTAEQLWQRGYAFDYISDRQLAQVKTFGVPPSGGSSAVSRVNAELRTSGGNYRVIVVPQCDVMPLATLEKLVALAKSGATVIFSDGLPKDVPGLGDLENRRAKFAALIAQTGGAQVGKGRILVGDVESALAQIGVARETMVDHAGLFYIRRASGGGRNYFIANRSERAIEGWLPLATSAKSVVLMDAMSGRTGVGEVRSAKGGTEVYVQLQPGESIIVRTSDRETSGAKWSYERREASSDLLVGRWKVDFISGGPQLPPSATTLQLGSWTELGDAAKSFSGTARYSLTFDARELESNPATSGVVGKTGNTLKRELQQWSLDLGNVVQSARVTLNGKSFGTLLIPPYRVTVDNLKPTGNKLEVEVTSTSANRIRDLDQRGVKWQNFYDINFVNQDYKPFNAANWALADAGLLGPVTLTQVMPLKLVEGGR